MPPPDYTPLGEVLSGEPLAGQPFIPAERAEVIIKLDHELDVHKYEGSYTWQCSITSNQLQMQKTNYVTY